MQSLQVSRKATDKIEGSSLHSKTLKFLAVLIFFFSTTQFGFHFWSLSALVYGIRVDYLAPTLYFLDLLILLYLGFELRSLRDFRRVIVTSVSSPLLPILLVNLLYSQNPLSTLNWSLHFTLYYLFISKYSFKSLLTKSLVFTMIFQLLLAGLQVWLGHSVGGGLYYLGERTIAVGAPNIATATFMGQVILRAYGTFSHPNILAGWLVLASLIVLSLAQNRFQKYTALAVAAIGIFLTNSHSAALALFGLIIPIYLFKNFQLRALYFLLGFLACWFVGLSLPLLSRLDLSLSQRLELQQLSLQTISRFPLFGTGGQSSISAYPLVSSSARLLQPDHDSFTLFLSWFGIFGLLTLLSSLNPRPSILVKLIPILPLLLLDHYLLTSPQGLFILLLYLQIALNYSHAQKNR